MNNPTYYTCFTEVVDKMSRTHAIMFGLLRQLALKSNDGHTVISQPKIKAITGLHHNQQSKCTADLEDWGLLKVIRNEKTGRILRYQLFETNFQIFIHFPDQYENTYDSNQIEHLCTTIKTKKFVDPEFAARLVQGALENDAFNIEKIKQNLAILEKRALKIDRAENSDCSGGDPSRSLRPVIKDFDVNVKQAPSEPADDSGGVAGKKAKLNRRTVVPKKQSIRSQLKGTKPAVVQKKPAKLVSVEKYHNNRFFIQVKRHWNSLSGLREIAELTDKQNNTLCNSVLAVKALLSGRLLKTGMIDIKGYKVVPELPKGFDAKEHDINVAWLLDKITIFHKIVNDQKLLPRNKDYLRRLSLGEFILGANGKMDRGLSVLFQHCCGELRSVQEDPNPKLTKNICKQYNLYTEQNKTFSGADLQNFIKLGERIMEFAKTPDARRSITMGKGSPSRIAARFFVAQDQEWRGRITEQTPAYFSGEHAWGVFKKRLQF